MLRANLWDLFNAREFFSGPFSTYSLLLTRQHLVHVVRCLLLLRRHDMAVGIHRQAYVTMSQNLHHYARMHPCTNSNVAQVRMPEILVTLTRHGVQRQ